MLLVDLGERESGTQHLTEAVAAYRAALLEFTQARAPRNWAMTQSNLANALAALGKRTRDTSELCQALGDHVSAWRAFSGAARRTTLQSLSLPQKEMLTQSTTNLREWVRRVCNLRGGA